MDHCAKFDSASFVLAGEIHNRTNKQTVTDISTPCLSACLDNKPLSQLVRIADWYSSVAPASASDPVLDADCWLDILAAFFYCLVSKKRTQPLSWMMNWRVSSAAARLCRERDVLVHCLIAILLYCIWWQVFTAVSRVEYSVGLFYCSNS